MSQFPKRCSATCGGASVRIVDALVVHDKGRLDTEDGVAAYPRVIVGVELGDHGAKACRGDDHVEMGWAHVVSAGRTQQVTDRSVVGDGVTDRLDRPQLIAAVVVGDEASTQVVIRLARVGVLV